MTIHMPLRQFRPPAIRFHDNWMRAAMVLTGAWAALLVLFHRDTADLATIYWTNTTFGHCLFVAPVVGWLVWQRRRELALVRPEGWWPGLVLVLGGGLCWLIGDAAGVALFRHLGLVVMLQGAAIGVLGANVARALLFPLCYMFFLVPFGEFFEPPLQQLTIGMVMPLLHLFGVPASVDGVLITTSNGYFEVAEACSGAKFLIAMIAYGVLVANVCYRSWRRRIAFMALALVVPVIANGLRAFGTIYVAWWTSVEQATGMDHIVYGWFFFAFVMGTVLAIGWRWFDRDPDGPWFDPAALQAQVPGRIDAQIAAIMAVLIAGLFFGWAGAIAARATPLGAAMELPQIAGWQRQGPTSEWSPNFPEADRFLQARYVDRAGRAVDVAVALYAGQAEGKELVGFGIGAIRENDRWVRVADIAPVADGHAIRMVDPERVERQTVSWYRVGGTLTGSDNRVKIETLKTKLLGRDETASAVLISAEQGRNGDAGAVIQDFLQALGPVEALADELAGAR
ncbi:exosortase A [Sphingomonas xinjiangensis]|uniref:Exosortase A n=1 Tax=Sphingomonas xinjiangensis TaxID=643568 RepID=A0A840YDI5_9SPHN|nr:exosortase A [Sphingomonas xinjiangensis]MBB5708858.1 exosortase A [Sphingomonas xinjiangensis]